MNKRKRLDKNKTVHCITAIYIQMFVKEELMGIKSKEDKNVNVERRIQLRKYFKVFNHILLTPNSENVRKNSILDV